MNQTDILKKLSQETAVSGFEKAFSQTLAEMFAPFCDQVEVDRFYNVIGIKKGSDPAAGRMMVTAHYDEIGFLVKGIDENGFITLAAVGGIDAKILLAQEVIVHGRENIPGVIGAKPPHLLKAEETKKAVKLEDLSVDTGLSAEKLRQSVNIGDVVTVKAQFLSLQGDRVSGKALDNRSGVAALLETMQLLERVKHSADIWFVATTQEELWLTGVITAAYNTNPDAALVVDAGHGDMPDTSREETFTLGKGPAIGIGPNLDRNLTRQMIQLAGDLNIPYQTDVEPGDTGTEAWATQISREGIPTVLLSIPVRYMHTPIETLQISDVRSTGRLAAAFIANYEKKREDGACC